MRPLLHAAQLRVPLVPDVPDVVVQRHVVEGFVVVEVVLVHVHDVLLEPAGDDAEDLRTVARQPRRHDHVGVRRVFPDGVVAGASCSSCPASAVGCSRSARSGARLPAGFDVNGTYGRAS